MKAVRIRAILINAFYWVFGVGTCAYYTAVTLNGCSQAPYLLALFSPLAIIPLSNAILLLAGSRFVRPTSHMLPLLGSISGIALLVAAILVTVLSPLCLMAVLFGSILFLVLPISALCFFYLGVATGPVITCLAMRWKLKTLSQKSSQKTNWLPLSSCLALVLTFILIGIFPISLTQACEAAIAEPVAMNRGLLLLRALGDDNAMLQACYGEHVHVPWFFDMALSFASLHGLSLPTYEIPEVTAREIYYRVKGTPFNTAPRTRLTFLGGNSPLFENDFGRDESFDWDYDYYSYLDYSDHDFAGETVGGVVRGLSLDRSEIKGWADADEAVAHLTWNQHFKVDKGHGKEIREQILLPPHAVITGCSLWINGVKHDSVIATRESSRGAYTTAAVRGEKPLLVSTAGAGRVLVQSSTGYWGKEALLVLQITTPLTLLQGGKAALPLPIFAERNFSVTADHEISLTSSTAALPWTQDQQTTNGRLMQRLSSDKTQPAVQPDTLTAGTLIKRTINNTSLANGAGAIIFNRNSAIAQIAAPDPADPKVDIVQRITTNVSPVAPVIIVVDGSAAMASQINSICDTLKKIDSKDASILWASDRPLIIASHLSTATPAWNEALNKLRDSSCLGGQNNAESLSMAITDIARQSTANIVWLHAGQPVKFSGDKLLALLTDASNKITLFEYQVVPGPNEVVKSLDQTNLLHQVPRVVSLEEDLNSLLARLSGSIPTYSIERASQAHGTVAAPLAKHAPEIAQLYVSDLVFANLANQSERVKYGKLAETHNLVTPLTSALVLDDKSNYEKYGVKGHAKGGGTNASAANKLGGLSAFSGFIPVKPEPPMSLILACGLSMMGIISWLKRRRRQHS